MWYQRLHQALTILSVLKINNFLRLKIYTKLSNIIHKHETLSLNTKTNHGYMQTITVKSKTYSPRKERRLEYMCIIRQHPYSSLKFFRNLFGIWNGESILFVILLLGPLRTAHIPSRLGAGHDWLRQLSPCCHLRLRLIVNYRGNHVFHTQCYYDNMIVEIVETMLLW
jgi:hypothetical protein